MKTIKLLQWQTHMIFQVLSIDVSEDFFQEKYNEFLDIANTLNLACVKCNTRSIAWVEVEG